MMSRLEQVVEYGVCPHVWGVCEECQAKVDAYLDGRNAAWANYCPNDGQPLDVETLARAYCSPYQPRAYALAWAEGYRAQALAEETRYHATAEA